MKKKIFLSPSSQTENSYAYGGTNEAAQCKRIADATKVALERCGFEVKINHLGSLYEKVAQSNAWPADLHIPIHTNAFNGSVSGTRMFYYSPGGNSYKACKAIYDVLAPITPGTSESISAYPGLYEMQNTNATSVYIEVDFHDVSSVAKWIIEHPVEIGEAICKGVCNYYGATYKTNSQAASSGIEPEEIKLVSGAKYTSGQTIPSWVINSKLYKRDVRPNGDVVFSTLKTGAVTGVVSPKYIVGASSGYIVKVLVDELNVRSGPSTDYKIVTSIKDYGSYTIIEESSDGHWGLLKAYASNKGGWICLDYTKKV